MNFNDNPNTSGKFWGLQQEEWIENISLITIEPKVIWLKPMKM
jgi:hypothetical protein